MRYCPIETLQPAKITIESPQKKNIVICASQTLLTEAIISNNTSSVLPTDSLIANILFSLLQLWRQAPGYEDAQISGRLSP